MVYSDVSPSDGTNVVPGAPVHEDPSSLDRDGTRRARSEVNGIGPERGGELRITRRCHG
jgi:hypothetical protein